jgi:ankyrin repeat protein
VPSVTDRCSGADIGKQDVDGNSALMLAARHGHCSVVEVLLDAGRRRCCRRRLITTSHRHPRRPTSSVDLRFVDIRNKHGQTALHEAAKGGHAAITAALVFAGASVDCADRWLNRPLQYATLHGHTAVVALLAAQRCDVNAPNLGRRTALHTAAQNGHSDIAGILLGAGACTTVRDSEGDTPTLLAGRYQHRSVFEQLIAASSVPDVFDHSDSLGKNAFHYAAANGYIELVIGVLQKFDAHQLRLSSTSTDVRSETDYSRAPDWGDMKGNTALMLAVRRNHVEVS